VREKRITQLMVSVLARVRRPGLWLSDVLNFSDLVVGRWCIGIHVGRHAASLLSRERLENGEERRRFSARVYARQIAIN